MAVDPSLNGGGAVAEGWPGSSRPVLPDISTDETGEGWGESAEQDDDDARFLRELPPHHMG